jgi:hypothetical protein
VNVLVAAVHKPDCPAARALLTEGVGCEIVVMEDDHDYAVALGAMWQRLEEFCIVEHDVVTWPGAITEIAGCEEPWCVYQYPASPSRMRNALGFVRVSRKLVQSHPALAERWAGVHWNALDGRVYRALRDASGTGPHVHSPPVAHVKFHASLEMV